MKILTTILSICISIPLLSQKTDKLTKKADILYQKKEFGNAAVLYHQAAGQKPGDATISYNLGIAEFKAGNYDNSITAFERSTLFICSNPLNSDNSCAETLISSSSPTTNE